MFFLVGFLVLCFAGFLLTHYGKNIGWRWRATAEYIPSHYVVLMSEKEEKDIERGDYESEKQYEKQYEKQSEKHSPHHTVWVGGFQQVLHHRSRKTV